MNIITARHLNATYKHSVTRIRQTHTFREDDMQALTCLNQEIWKVQYKRVQCLMCLINVKMCTNKTINVQHTIAV